MLFPYFTVYYDSRGYISRRGSCLNVALNITEATIGNLFITIYQPFADFCKVRKMTKRYILFNLVGRLDLIR